MKNKGKKNALAVTVCVAAIVLTVTAAITFIKRVEDVAVSEKMNYLQSVSSRGADVIMSKLRSGLAVVESVAGYIEGTGNDMFSDASIKGIHNIVQKSDFENVALTDSKGTVYNAMNGVPINVENRLYFTRSMAGESVISNIIDSRDDGSYAVVMSAPVREGDKVIGNVIARYSSSGIDALLDKSLSDQDIRCYICHSDGDVFAAAKIPDTEKRMTDIISDIQHQNNDNRPAMVTVKSDMMNNKKGYVEITYSNEKFLLNYEPVGINDLYCVAMMPYNKITTNIKHTTDIIIWLSAGSLMVLISLLLYYMIMTLKKKEESEQTKGELDVIYGGVPNGIFRCTCDSSMRVLFANDYFYSLIDISKKQFSESYDSSFASIIKDGVDDIIDGADLESVIAVEKNIVHEGAEGKWVNVSVKMVENAETGEKELFCTLTDMNLTHNLYNELHMQEKRCGLMLDQTKDIIFEWNYDTSEMFYSKHFDEKFGYTPLINDFPDGFVHLGIVYREDRQAFLNLFKTINMGSGYSEDEIRIRKNDGGYLWCKMSIMAVRDENNTLHRIIGIITDIDAEKRENGGAETAKYDPLTMLYNKEAAEEVIEEILSNKSQGQCAFLIVDIDNFKEVNDKLGRKVGDETLKELAIRIQGLFRDGDIISRIGGDDFVVFMRNITGEQIAEYKAKCIVQALEYTATGDNGQTVSITGSVGLGFAPKDGTTYTQLYSRADKALYYAKKQGKSKVAIYNSELDK